MIFNEKVCICGGGNIGHSLAAVLGRHSDVRILTRRPQAWSERLRFQISDRRCEETGGRVIACDKESIVSICSLIIVALPRFVIEETLSRLEPHLHEGQTVVFIPAPAGMETIVERMAQRGVEVIGFQRVPYIARIKEYGKFVWMGDLRSESKVAVSNPMRKDYWKEYFAGSIGGTVSFLSSFLSFTFSNSNPLLHPARLVELLRNKKGYQECPYFYREWGDEASKLYVSADIEMRDVFAVYSSEAMDSDYESALAHYNVGSVSCLAEKIRSIKALGSILAPYTKGNDGFWHPDLRSRYFTEDVPYGTKVIQKYAKRVGVPTPTVDFLIDSVMHQMQSGEWLIEERYGEAER